MRDQREDERLADLDEIKGAEARIITWILTSDKRGFPKGFFAREAISAIGSHKTTTCRLLREMLETDTLSRYKVGGRWFYKIKDPHDPEDYINDLNAGRIIARTYAAYAAGNRRLMQANHRLKKMGKVHDLYVSCDCGRRLGFKVKLEEILDDSSEGRDEGNGSFLPTDSVLGLTDS